MKVTERGFWEGDVENTHAWSKPLAEWLAGVLPQRLPVHDFGCGMGDYAAYLAARGFAVTGYEGSPSRLIRHDNVVAQDLSQRFAVTAPGHVVTLEVGEHIPRAYEDVFLDNITRACAPDGTLILSWAVRGQPGDGHVNCLDNQEVVDRLRRLGFHLDGALSAESRKLPFEPLLGHFAGTLMVFRRRQSIGDVWKDGAALTAPMPLMTQLKTKHAYDIVFWDTVGGPFSAGVIDESRAGGSEWATIKAARELAKRGLKVLCATNGGEAACVDGVDYCDYRHIAHVDTGALVIQRHSRLPSQGDYDKLFVAVHDAGTGFLSPKTFPLLERRHATLLAVGQWQRSLFPAAWRSAIVSTSLPPTMPKASKTPGRFVFPAAYAGRGLTETLEYWARLKPPGGQLVVLIPPYGGSLPKLPEGVIAAPPSQRLVEFARAEGVFYVNVQPECLPNLYIAEALGCRLHVLGLCPNGLCGLRDVSSSPLITTDARRFEVDFKKALGTAAPSYSNSFFTATALGDRWVKALSEAPVDPGVLVFSRRQCYMCDGRKGVVALGRQFVCPACEGVGTLIET